MYIDGVLVRVQGVDADSVPGEGAGSVCRRCCVDRGPEEESAAPTEGIERRQASGQETA